MSVVQGHPEGVWWQDEGKQGVQVWSRALRHVRQGRHRVTNGSNTPRLVRGGARTLLPPKNLGLCPQATTWVSLSLDEPSCPLAVPRLLQPSCREILGRAGEKKRGFPRLGEITGNRFHRQSQFHPSPRTKHCPGHLHPAASSRTPLAVVPVGGFLLPVSVGFAGRVFPRA